MVEVIDVDFLVLGSGVAGLRAALGLARHGRVLVVTKDQPTESNTGYAQGGVAAAMGVDDDVELHLADTLGAGAGIVSRPAARVLVEEGPARIRELVAWGARFDREEGRFHFTREGAHSRSRVLHALGDSTGWEMVRTLLEKTQAEGRVSVRSFACSTDLERRGERVAGCRFLQADGRAASVQARATLLATGGGGQVFAETTNPAVATGDGVAMAWRAGAALLDMEFVQFHPTALAVAGAPRFLISEAVRGEGALLLNARGERFVDELRPRDQVARAILQEQREGRGPVGLDLRALDPSRVKARFPRIHATCRRYGIEIPRDLIPVTPAAHYLMGGVGTDLHGRTTLPGLFAAGEAAATGVHGANRLASNSLLEGLVFGARAADAMAEDAAGPAPTSTRERVEPRQSGPAAPGDPGEMRAEIQRLSWECLGLTRDAGGLARAIAFLERAAAGWAGEPRGRAETEARNLADVALAMSRCALFREESRGAHYRSDHPERDETRFHGHTWLDGRGARLADVDLPVASGVRC